ncbi:MAG TPA: hypothetical protein VK864_00375 [Longimicrobiales bacterium]|nr:hypothetical protein [Longimicrobiales bacterium]
MNSELPGDQWSAAFNRYIAEIEAYPRLYADDEQTTMERAEQGDDAAVRALVEANLRFVIRIAEIYAGQGLSLPTLVRFGNAALIDAAYNPRPARSSGFMPHAVWRIRQAILQALASPAAVPALPAQLAAARWSELLLEAEPPDGPTTRQPATRPEQRSTTHRDLDRPDDLFALLRENLTELQLQVLSLYFGLTGEPIGMDVIAERLGISPTEVQAARNQAFARLRTL